MFNLYYNAFNKELMNIILLGYMAVGKSLIGLHLSKILNKKFIDLVRNVKPHQVTLVPDKPNAITSNSGWDTIKNYSFLKEIIAELSLNSIRTSIFLDPNIKFIYSAAKTGADRIELYTEFYSKKFEIDRKYN